MILRASCLALLTACTSLPELVFIDDAGSGAADGSAADRDANVPADSTAGCVCGAPGCGDCPPTEVVAFDGYGVDVTEVTVADYAAFLSAPVPAQNVTHDPPSCASNATYTPSLAQDDGRLPVVGVDWCDAFAFCRWAGKRLCGRIGGGSLDTAKLTDFRASEWYAACSEAQPPPAYPYGESLDPIKCNGAARFNPPRLAPVGSLADCRASNEPFNKLRDMAGNAAEWEDACGDDQCAVRGGSFRDGAPKPACHLYSLRPRATADETIGFRCCAR